MEKNKFKIGDIVFTKLSSFEMRAHATQGIIFFKWRVKSFKNIDTQITIEGRPPEKKSDIIYTLECIGSYPPYYYEPERNWLGFKKPIFHYKEVEEEYVYSKESAISNFENWTNLKLDND